MLQNYLPILIFILLATGIGIVLLIGGRMIGRPYQPDEQKCAPYECGFGEFENTRLPFDVKFYLVAILFIIFDLETAFLFPWAVVLRKISWFGIGAMTLFLGLLVIGFIYEWKKGALEWE